MNLDQREKATVLAALRGWQSAGMYAGSEIGHIATNIGEFEALDHNEIDALCERINFAQPDVLEKPVCTHCGSDDVTRDGILRWSVQDQRWEVSAELQNEDCNACGGECDLKMVPA